MHLYSSLILCLSLPLDRTAMNSSLLLHVAFIVNSGKMDIKTVFTSVFQPRCVPSRWFGSKIQSNFHSFSLSFIPRHFPLDNLEVGIKSVITVSIVLFPPQQSEGCSDQSSFHYFVLYHPIFTFLDCMIIEIKGCFSNFSSFIQRQFPLK